MTKIVSAEEKNSNATAALGLSALVDGSTRIHHRGMDAQVSINEGVGAENPIPPVQAVSRYSSISPARTSVRRMQAGSGLVIGTLASLTSEGHR